jgi:multidrug efflux pump subunit AcrB
VSLAYFQLVVLKMLPFDNKSEFQIIVDMPVGTPVEETARVLQEIGAEWPGFQKSRTTRPMPAPPARSTSTAWCASITCGRAPEKGDIQVNLVDKAQRSRQSHEIAAGVRAAVEAVGQRNGGNRQGRRSAAGAAGDVAHRRRDLRPRLRRPDRRRQAGAPGVRGETADIVAVDDYHRRRFAQVRAARRCRPRPRNMGVAQATSSRWSAGPGRHGCDAGTQCRFKITPCRCACCCRRAEIHPRRAAQAAVRSRDGALVPVSELVEVRDTVREQTIYHKDLLPVVYVVGDMGGALDSPLYGMFDIRSKINGMELKEGGTLGEWFIRQPTDPYAGYSVKWDGEWQVTYETFRDMGLAYAVGLILIYLLVVAHFGSYLVPLVIMAPIPLTIIGVMPGHALFGAQFTATSMIGMIALAGIIVRNSILLVDFIKQQVARRHGFPRRGDPVARRCAPSRLR